MVLDTSLAISLSRSSFDFSILALSSISAVIARRPVTILHGRERIRHVTMNVQISGRNFKLSKRDSIVSSGGSFPDG